MLYTLCYWMVFLVSGASGILRLLFLCQNFVFVCSSTVACPFFLGDMSGSHPLALFIYCAVFSKNLSQSTGTSRLIWKKENQVKFFQIRWADYHMRDHQVISIGLRTDWEFGLSRFGESGRYLYSGGSHWSLAPRVRRLIFGSGSRGLFSRIVCCRNPLKYQTFGNISEIPRSINVVYIFFFSRIFSCKIHSCFCLTDQNASPLEKITHLNSLRPFSALIGRGKLKIKNRSLMASLVEEVTCESWEFGCTLFIPVFILKGPA